MKRKKNSFVPNLRNLSRMTHLWWDGDQHKPCRLSFTISRNNRLRHICCHCWLVCCKIRMTLWRCMLSRHLSLWPNSCSRPLSLPKTWSLLSNKPSKTNSLGDWDLLWLRMPPPSVYRLTSLVWIRASFHFMSLFWWTLSQKWDQRLSTDCQNWLKTVQRIWSCQTFCHAWSSSWPRRVVSMWREVWPSPYASWLTIYHKSSQQHIWFQWCRSCWRIIQLKWLCHWLTIWSLWSQFCLRGPFKKN